jgi:ATP-binding cassette subfamily F protein uup
MSSLIDGQDLSKSFGPRTLFDGVSLTLHEGDRIGLIGPNGAGKTTLLRILAGDEAPDSGSVVRRRGLRTAYVPQESHFDGGATVLELVAGAADEVAAAGGVESDVERSVRVRILLDQIGFADVDQRVEQLSGGWNKRLAVAVGLACDPDVLLLDEPTNHLDLEGIQWLEEFLTSGTRTYAVISHDRTFLERIARRVIEVSPRYPGGVLAVDGSYTDFVLAREEFLAGRAHYREGLANRVRREVEWLGRGPKARTTKAQARIRQAEQMQDELSDLQSEVAPPAAGIDMVGSGRRTKRLLVGTGIGIGFGDIRLLEGLDLVLTPGMRVAVVGANGSGKSTLLRVLAGELDLDSGSIRRAENLRTVYFDQGRQQIDPSLTLQRALAGLSDTVLYRDRSIHVASWAQRFLFRVDQLGMRLDELSGGEQARVHIARLMLQPADLLLLDEPTNDLDIPTLEVLEESLLDFPGALVLVTHDRRLRDRVATTVLAMDGLGGAEFHADSNQWQRSLRDDSSRKRERSVAAPEPGSKRKRKGLTYLEKRELEGMEEAILAADAALAEAVAALDDPVIASDAHRAHIAFVHHEEMQRQVDDLYRRWSELEERAEPGK